VTFNVIFPVLYKSFTFFLTYLFTSLRIGPLCFQARDRKRRSNLTLVFLLYILYYHIFLRMLVCFRCVRFSFTVLSQEIDWEECLRNDVFCLGWNVNLTQLKVIPAIAACNIFSNTIGTVLGHLDTQRNRGCGTMTLKLTSRFH